ncbi:MAG: rod shape-determining protein [Chloroflexota bacterium]|nr:rod shape-determining protein [Chloroflexota bacterium]
MTWWRGQTQRAHDTMVGIDAGNVDVRVVIAGAVTTDADDARMPVLGHGIATAQGLTRGVVSDARGLGGAIRVAVEQAEKAAGHRVLGGYFSVPLAQFASPTSRRECIVLQSPIAVREMTHHATDRTPAWREVARHAGLEVVGIVPSVLAATAAVALPDEHDGVVVIIECGAEHTSIAVFSGGTVVCLGSVPVGGDHITRDLATVLRIDPMEAERLKFEVGNVRSGVSDIEVLVRGLDGGRTAVSVSLVAAIISARVDQLLAHVGEIVRPVTTFARGGGTVGQVILCGGGAALSGLAPMARAALGMPVRVAGAWGFAGPATMQSPGFAAVLGLLRWRAIVEPGLRTRTDVGQNTRASVGAAAGNGTKFPVQPMRIGQTRWQAWLREFLP